MGRAWHGRGAIPPPDESGGIQVGLKHVHDAVSNPGELSLDQFHADAHATNKPLDGRDFRNTIIQMQAYKKFWDDRILASVLAYWRINLLHFYSDFHIEENMFKLCFY